MKNLKMCSLALAMLAGGCGAGTASDYANATPTYQTLALDMESSDSNTQTTAALTNPSCHPHLFERTREVVATINAELWAVHHFVDGAVDDSPDAKSGTSRTWTRKVDGYSIQAVIDETSVGNFTLTVGVAPETGSSYTTYLTGTLVAGSTPHTGTGTLSMDLTTLGSVVSAVKAQGQFTVTYAVDGASKVIDVAFTGFQPPDGFNAADLAIRPPRNGTYVYARTTGVGGSLKFNEQVDLLCPAQPTPLTPDISTVNTVAVWTHDPSSGDLVGRADSQGTDTAPNSVSDPQIPAGNRWEGTTCFDISKDTDGTGINAETYWMMKEETSAGATVVSTSLSTTVEDSSTATPPVLPSACAAMFLPTPDLTDDTNDYNFGAVTFTDTSIVAYPGEPDGGL